MRSTGTYAKGAKGKADRLFSLIVRSRGVCESCGDRSYEKLQCAHIVSRVYNATRTDETNAFCLCWTCHRRFTDNPFAWVDFVVSKIGRDEYECIAAKAKAGLKAGKTYWIDEAARLTARWAELEGRAA